MERPSTKEKEAATLYLTDLKGMKKNGDETSDLLCFYAKVKTSSSKTRSAYTLMDPGASHCYIDSTYAKQLGLPLRHAGRMLVITAGTKHPTSERYQVWLEGNIDGIAGNYTAITGWYTLFDLKGAYDLIVGKNWHSTTLLEMLLTPRRSLVLALLLYSFVEDTFTQERRSNKGYLLFFLYFSCCFDLLV